MTVQDKLRAALSASKTTDEAEAARLWLDRVEILLDWIARHPKLVEVRSEAARLLVDYRNGDSPTPLAANRR